MIRITTQNKENCTIVTIDGQVAEEDLGEIRRVRKSMKGEVCLNLHGVKSCVPGGIQVLRDWLDTGVKLEAATLVLRMLLEAPRPDSHPSKIKISTNPSPESK